MPDEEKVANGLRICFMQKDCDGCPYQKELKAILDKSHNNNWYCPILDDALVLIKEQKAKPVITTTKDFIGISVAIRHNCPSCGNGLYGASGEINYCSFCGQKLDWEQEGW